MIMTAEGFIMVCFVASRTDERLAGVARDRASAGLPLMMSFFALDGAGSVGDVEKVVHLVQVLLHRPGQVDGNMWTPRATYRGPSQSQTY